MTSETPGMGAAIRPLIRTQILLGGAVAGTLFVLGMANAGLGILYGAALGTVNALAMMGRLEGAVQAGAGKGKGFLQRGVFVRFFLILGFMGVGFYYLKLHIASLLAGFILFQFIALGFLWREMKRGWPRKTGDS